MAKRYKACRWWKGGHKPTKWEPALYEATWKDGRTKVVSVNERTCEKCGYMETKEVRIGR
jgi:hypothetical protein